MSRSVYSPSPVGTAYTLDDVARICGVSPRRLRYWERTELVRQGSSASETPAGPRAGALDAIGESRFEFRDIVSVKSIVELLEQGVPLRKIRRGICEVRASLPDVEATGALRWQPIARCMVVRHEGVLMEPDGQLVLEFPLEGEAPVAQLTEHIAAPGSPEARVRAQRLFEQGCGLDTEPATWDQAEEAYRQAIEADPEYADAHCNLGSVRFNRGQREQARASFERAIELVPGHVEANLNVGTMYEELGQDESALARYRAALETDPLYADVHVSLALLYEKISLVRTAVSHWRRYLQLDPQGTWADIARRRVATH